MINIMYSTIFLYGENGLDCSGVPLGTIAFNEKMSRSPLTNPVSAAQAASSRNTRVVRAASRLRNMSTQFEFKLVLNCRIRDS